MKKVLLFQPYLRQHILNFGRNLKRVEFEWKPTETARYTYQMLPEFEKEINRVKKNKINTLRQIFGIPNIRFKYVTSHDLLFTYGCMLFSNKPFVTYLETGLAPFNYSLRIARHPLARWLFLSSALTKNCRKLIFMSEAAKKSFFGTLNYTGSVRQKLEGKSVVIYPLVPTQASSPKAFPTQRLKLLFVGIFYMKGGLELVHAFQKLTRMYPDQLELTLVTLVHMVRPSDLALMRDTPGINLIDATLNEEKMRALYSEHHIFTLPTFREGFGLVLVEALAHGMPIIATDQFATTEMVINDYNGFTYRNHPLKDYDPKTFRMLGKYYHPRNFYQSLFALQSNKALLPIEEFIFASIEQYLKSHSLFEKHSQNSVNLFMEKFSPAIISKKIEDVFIEAAT